MNRIIIPFFQTNPHALAQSLSNHHFIHGSLTQPKNGKIFPIHNPATGKKIGEAARGDKDDIQSAVSSALEAQKEWKKKPVRERGRILTECSRVIFLLPPFAPSHFIFQVLNEHVEEIGQLIALETGKAIRTESRMEASLLSNAFEYYGGLAPEIKGEVIPFSEDALTCTLREPLGVVGVIIPWNVPAMLMAIKIAPALVCGNSVVVKSAEEAPFSVLRVAEILGKVLPPGVFNMVI